MKIAIFVHEFNLEVGHSHALIETIRNLPQETKKKISKIKIVAFESDLPEKLFPEFEDIVEVKLLPHFFKKPFLFKMISYHLLTFFYSKFFLKDWFKISIGIASMDADLVNIQFLHKQWSPLYFSNRNLKLIPLIYKKILFFYFNLFEDLLYKSKSLKISALSQFVYDYMRNEYQIPEKNIVLAYSGVNLDRFSPVNKERLEIFNELKNRYEVLNIIRPEETIYLFVGAFERKGLEEVFRELKKKKDPQLILVGRSEASSQLTFPKEIRIAHIPFTKELPLFYSLSDHFLFPTHYEPFGLVLIEAAASGMYISTTKKFVGASEILVGLKGIDIYKDPQEFNIADYSPLDNKKRDLFYNERITSLQKLSWDKTGSAFGKLLLNFSIK